MDGIDCSFRGSCYPPMDKQVGVSNARRDEKEKGAAFYLISTVNVIVVPLPFRFSKGVYVVGSPITYIPLLNRNGKETTITFTVDIK